ncbi:MAG: AMP-binding protein, partial [Solirubrobacteraceae bacterium]
MSSVPEQVPLWEPTAGDRERAEMTRFMRFAGACHGRAFADYDELWKWSVAEVEEFWASIWEFCGVRASKPYERVLPAREMPGTRWFEGAELNYAENLLLGPATPARGADAGPISGQTPAASDSAGRDPDEVAVLHCSELRELSEMTWGELTGEVARAAAGLRALGVARGDRVVAYMPNIPETLVAFLATASIGAIFSSAAPEFGARSVIDRFAQIEPKVLLAVDGYRHGGKDFDRLPVVRGILAELPTVEHAVLLPYLSADASATDLPGGMRWDQLLTLGEGSSTSHMCEV